MYERKSAPAPPYSSGTQAPISPSSASFANSSRGKRCSRSQAAAWGSISATANSRVSAWISRCSGERSKSTLPYSSASAAARLGSRPAQAGCTGSTAALGAAAEPAIAAGPAANSDTRARPHPGGGVSRSLHLPARLPRAGAPVCAGSGPTSCRCRAPRPARSCPAGRLGVGPVAAAGAGRPPRQACRPSVRRARSDGGSRAVSARRRGMPSRRTGRTAAWPGG